MGFFQKLFSSETAQTPAEPQRMPADGAPLPISHESNARELLGQRWTRPKAEPGSYRVLSQLLGAAAANDGARLQELAAQHGPVIERNFKAWVKDPGEAGKTDNVNLILGLGQYLQNQLGFRGLLAVFTIPPTDDPLVKLAAIASSARANRVAGDIEDGWRLSQSVLRSIQGTSARERRLQAIVSAEIGDCRLLMGEYGEALDSYRQALTLCEQIGDAEGVSAYVRNLWYAEAAHGDRVRAVMHGEHLAKLLRETAPDHAAAVYEDLADLCRDMGRTSEAAQHERVAADLRR